jgi:hypothetical protein
MRQPNYFLLEMSSEVLMKSERKMLQEETGVAANGFRPRRIQPVLLSVIRAENEEHQKLSCY